MTPAEQLKQAARFKNFDYEHLLEEMKQRQLRIENQVEILEREIKTLEHERNLLRYKCVLLGEKLEAKQRAEGIRTCS